MLLLRVLLVFPSALAFLASSLGIIFIQSIAESVQLTTVAVGQNFSIVSTCDKLRISK
ncbi:MAG: hypothetical protein LBQ24_00890 [Candidatus Peribacteria bacterium]|nr:hypothetical protein [Candidatus Peribacteria bacterium]